MAKPSDVPAAKAKMIGRKALYQSNVLYHRKGKMQTKTFETIPPSWPVVVTNVRYAHGRIHLLLRPHRGEGSFWTVEGSKRLRFVSEWPHEQPPEPATLDAHADH